MTPQKNTFNGILNVYKEQGYTSHDVVAKLRGILKQKKIGHTGTLDPAAEGVLPVCLGKATKVCELLTDKDKTYQAVLHLGVVTDTQDMTGEILEQKDAAVSEAEVREAILGFVGEYAQVPPMYSALKVNGKKLCDLAREDMAEAVEDAFRYGKLVLASITYNGEAFPFMRTFIENLTERNYQNRTIGLIENGSWAPTAAKVMKGMFEKSKNITWIENNVKIMSSLSDENVAEIDAMAEELCK